ncbi:MAG: zinc-ribbon domain-containing protein [Streptosporangiales bacterium]|nr:zinc-ribbon domain-containing protein [Streptosporangiales bacterium]
MLIFGWASRWTKTHDGGTFECPTCGRTRQWAKIVLRNWFTLFFIPLIPGKVRDEGVECLECKTRFEAGVLTRVTEDQVQHAYTESRRLGVVAIVRHLPRTQRVCDVAVAMIAKRIDGYDAARLDDDVAGLDLAPLSAQLRLLGAHVSVEDKERVLRPLALPAVASDRLADARAAIDRMGSLLGLTPAHVHGVLAQLDDEVHDGDRRAVPPSYPPSLN